MKNLEIRLAVSDKGIRYKEIAGKLGIRHETLSRLLSKPLTTMWQSKIWNAIAEIEEARVV